MSIEPRSPDLVGSYEEAISPDSGCLHTLFARQAKATAERTAIVWGEHHLSYGALAARADRLARRLRRLGVGPEVLVAVMAKRTPELIVALLAVMKAGGAYVPIDPDYPAERRAYILDDALAGAATPIVLTEEGIAGLLPAAWRGHKVFLEENHQPSEPQPADELPNLAGTQNLAYLIYTSGSTGRPKGVAITHGSAALLVHWARQTFSDAELSGVLATTSICFDLSIFEIFVPLAWGGCVVLVDNALALGGARPEPAVSETQISAGSLIKTRTSINTANSVTLINTITLINTVPSAIAELVRSAALPTSLVTVNLAGEALKRPLVEAIHATGRVERVLNLYGPSEDTTYSTWTSVKRGENRVTIGRPLPCSTAHVLDTKARPVGRDELGELYLGGAKLARGYWHRPGLTARFFVPNPSSARGGERLYRTGDLVRRLDDGELDFRGRRDHQVKIRGFRIELGEVETALVGHPSVHEAAVVARALPGTAGDPRLVAFVATDGQGGSSSELRQHLAKRLPTAMVPSLFVALSTLPRSPNGKVDRAALLTQPLRQRAVRRSSGKAAGLTPPRSTAEAVIVELCAEILGLAECSTDDSFFALGGHSLDAHRLIVRLAQRYGVELDLPSFHRAADLAALARRVEDLISGPEKLTQDQIDHRLAIPKQRMPSIPRRRIGRQTAPIARVQEPLWLFAERYPKSTVYNITRAVDFHGALNARTLERALAALIERHEILRATFASERQQPVMKIATSTACPLPRIDLRRLSGDEREQKLRQLERIEARAGFDLRRGPLLRALLISWTRNRYRLLLSVHHLVFDGWSIGIFFAELAELYRAFSHQQPPVLAELPIQYGDFAAWEQQTVDEAAHAESTRYWRQRLHGTNGALELLGDHPRPTRPTLHGVMQHFTLPTELTRRLRQLAGDLEVSLFTILITAWAILLSRYAGLSTLLVATPVAGRRHPETEGLIGYFVNTLPIRFDFIGNPTVAELLGEIRDRLLADLAHQDLPSGDLQRALSSQGFTMPRATFAFQNAPRVPVIFDSLGVGEPRMLDPGQIDQDWVLSVEPPVETDPDAALSGWLAGAAELFAATTCQRLLRGLECLLDDLRPDRRLRQLTLLPAAERHPLLVEARDRAMAFPRHATVHGLFAATARAMPAAVALVDEHNNHLSYVALDRRANGLAQALTHLGVGVESCVALGLERSVEAVIAILGVLKVGGVFLPLDAEQPVDRLAFMAGEARCQMILADLASQEKAGGAAGRHQLPLVALTRHLATPCDQPPPTRVEAENLAYVMFTSGSTGKAKGVAVSHRNIVRLVRGNDFARLDRDETFLSFAPLAFDASTLELWGPLLNGGRLAIFPSGPAALGELASALRRQRVTTLWLTAGLFHQMVDLEVAALGGLRQLLAGGDVLSPERVRRVLAELPDTTLINGYGPTEATTFACCHAMTTAHQVGATVAIGRPLGNARVQVLDRYLEPAPIGVAGELLVAGDGVARGYAHRPALSAACFLPEPDAPRPGERMYRTGDLVRWRVDGRLEFLGRFDFQVKIRGFRIELDEIRCALEEHPGLAQGIVLTEPRGRDASDLRLIAFAVPSTGEAPSNEEVRGFLARCLPPYMVPSRVVLVDALPLGPTGKVDRAALTRLATATPRRDAGAAARVEPRNPLEESLLPIFSELLHGDGGSASEQLTVEPCPLGVEDDFFAHGGHSLLASQLIARVHALFSVELSLRDFFATPTVAGLAAAIERATGAEIPSLEPQPRSDGLPMPIARATSSVASRAPTGEPYGRDAVVLPSFAQERLWFLDQLLQNNAVYNIPWPLAIDGELDEAALEIALNRLVARHEVLRTTFTVRDGPEKDDQVVQVIHPRLEIALPVVELSGLAATDATAEQLCRADADRPFDLRRGPLLRAVLLRLGPTGHQLLLTLHHIASDGWSMSVVDRELGELYSAALLGRPAALPALPVQYADYALWQRSWLRGAMLERQIAFWRDALHGAPSLLELSTDRPRPAVLSYRGGVIERRLDPGLHNALTQLARSHRATPFMIVLAAFDILLMRHAGCDDLCVGFPVAGRRELELEKLIGFFVNTLVLRARCGPRDHLGTFLAGLRDHVLQALAHQDVPFERLVEELEPERSLSQTPFFQVMLAFLNAPIAPPTMHGLAVERLDGVSGTAKFDLTLGCEPSREGGLRCRLSYSSDLFDAATMERFLGGFETLLRGLIAAPEKPLAAQPLLDEVERHQIFAEWNDTATNLATDHTLSELVAARLATRPDAVAVTLGLSGEQLSGGELARRVTLLAGVLAERGIGPESLVGLAALRSLELVIGLLGILEAGGAYVPIDPSYPEDRQAMMIEDALGAGGVLLTQQALIDTLPRAADCEILALDTLPPGSGSAARRRARPDNLAYTIYTSGSTGKPKGTMNAHRPVLNRLLWLQGRDPLDANDHVLQKTPFSFDVSVWEFFWPLLTGARLVLARPEGHKDSTYLIALIHAERLTTLHFVPSMLQIFVEEPGLESLTSVTRVQTSGEALSAELAARFFARMPQSVALNNLYGPTEAAIEVTFWSCQRGGDVPIGRPIANTELHILDRQGEPAPIGVVGQLFIAGIQVARGYLDRPRLTAEKFLPDPWAPRPGARFYATGDLARWRIDGSIAYLGRLDTQVKVRGFRIELGEIEAHLRTHSAVREVVAQADGDRLFAFVVGAADAAVNADELRRHLAASLPEYMVPQALTLLDELPRLANGKIDRRALKKLAATSLPAPDAAHVAPRDPLEKLLAEIFSELLQLKKVSVESSFFALGGHSLLATRVVARVRSRLGFELPLRQVFETPTVAGLARVLSRELSGDEHRELDPIVPLPPGIKPQPSFSQERLWFLDQLEPGNSAYNMPLGFQVAGQLDIAALRAALGEIVRRHQVLRTVFEPAAGEARPRLLPWHSFVLPVIDLTALTADRRRRELRRLGREDSLRPFTLDKDLMLRVMVALLDRDEQGLLMNLHHIAGDGWSISVLLRELATLYQAARQDHVATLPRLAVQYADFAAWQRRQLSGERRARQVAYWKEHLAGAPPLLELPTDRPRPAVPSQRGARFDQHLSPSQAAASSTLAQRLGATPFMVLLAALGVTLGRASGQSDLVIGAPIAGRLHLATENLIGFFLNNLVLRLRPGATPRFADFLAQVRETVLAAYAYQELPFEKLVEELQPARALSYHPLFQVLLNLHNWDSPEGRTVPLGDLRLTWLELEEPLAKLDLNLHVLDLGDDGFELAWLYNRDLFDHTTVARLAHAFACFLESCAAQPERPWRQLAWQARGERHQLLSEWNDTAAYPLDELLHTRFEKRAANAPNAVGLVYKKACLSYGELDRRADELARHLRALGVGPEKLVGVHLERGLEMVLAVLGALKAGGAYVPLDPDLPGERLRVMVEDSHASALLTQERLAPGLRQLFPDDALPIVVLDRPLAASPVDQPPWAISSENLAYEIYTSGTTGRPKGVMCRHQGAVSYLRFMLETYHLRPGDRTLQLASLAFDPSVRELFGPLGSGGTIVLIEAAQRRDPVALLRRIDEERITGLLSVVPSLLRTLPDPGRGHGAWPSSLRTVMTNGEQLFLADVRQARQLLGQGLTVINQYGPTECTMVASYYPVPHAQTASAREVALIGRPISDGRLYVLGPDSRPTPIGAVGELHIATADLARGYRGRPAQTAQVFLPDPWSPALGGRRYATGDLVRRLRDGQLEFVGRRDHQVKVLGNRVELAEIEAALRRHPQVAAVVVIAWQKGPEVRLVAYLETPSELSRDTLREHLKASLPEYMVPSLWIFLDRLPLNPNGKVDRHALPPPSTAELGRGEFIAPRSGVETLLAKIWSELLEVECIGVKDSFFHLGGHSLHGIRSLYRLRELLDVHLETRLLFAAQTLEELAPMVEAQLLTQLEAISDDEATRQLATTPVEAATQSVEMLDALHEAAPLPSELATRLLALSATKLELRALRLHRALELSAAGQAIPRRGNPQRAPLSWIQETFWLIEQQERSAISVYRSSHLVTLHGRRCVTTMQGAFAALMERHEILRTRFAIDDQGCTYQEILPALPLCLPRVDLGALRPEDREAAAERAIAERALVGFDLGQPPLLRLLLIELAAERAHLLVILHHIITDHWSMGLFLREWQALHEALAARRPAGLPALDVQYADYAAWERQLLEGEAMEPLMAYWGDKLAGGMPQLVLHTDRPRPAEPSFRGAQILFELTPALTQALEAHDQAKGVSLFMTLLAAYKVVLFLHSDQGDILVASPVANRARIQTEKMLGCFVHMMVLRTDLSGDPTLDVVIDRVRETVLGAFAHQDIPFMLLVANFPPPDFAFDRSPFQTSFTFLNAPAAAAAKALEAVSGDAPPESLRLSDWQSVDRGATDQDLALWMSREGNRLVGNLVYDVDLFDRSSVERIVEDYKRVLERLAHAPEERLSRLRRVMLASAE